MISISLSIFQLSCSAKTTSFTSWLAGQLFEHFGMCREASVTPQMWNNLGTNLALYGHLPALTGGSGATIAIRCRHIAFRFDMLSRMVRSCRGDPGQARWAFECGTQQLEERLARVSNRQEEKDRGTCTAQERKNEKNERMCVLVRKWCLERMCVLNLASMIPAYSLMSFHPVLWFLKLIV